jgi:CheY-like chemotaxis protein
MDIQMPVMDGMEATKIIRNNLKISTPIVALTANAFKHDIDLYMSNGMNDYLIKPYKEEELYSKIEKYCRIGNKINKEFSSKPEIDNYTSLPTNIETESLYNLKQLNVIANGDKKFVETMINMFINIAKTTISQLNEAFQNNDIEQIKKLSHKIKPSLDNLEINILYNEIRALENFNQKTGCPENLRTMVEFVTETLVKVIDDLLLSKTEKA